MVFSIIFYILLLFNCYAIFYYILTVTLTDPYVTFIIQDLQNKLYLFFKYVFTCVNIIKIDICNYMFCLVVSIYMYR